jgi:hypothetical protein
MSSKLWGPTESPIQWGGGKAISLEALRFPVRRGSRISRQSARTGTKVVSSTRRPQISCRKVKISVYRTNVQRSCAIWRFTVSTYVKFYCLFIAPLLMYTKVKHAFIDLLSGVYSGTSIDL